MQEFAMAISTPSPTSIIAASASLSALCIVAVAMRFWERKLQRAKFSIDDWLVIPALFLTVGMGAAMITGVRLKALGYPTPARDLSNPETSSDQTAVSEQLEWAIQMMQVVALGAVKLSFVFFFRRIFIVHISRKFAIASTAMISIIIIWTVAFFFGFVWCGTRFSAWWGPHFRTECTGLSFENGLVLSDCIMDVLIMAMPIPMVWQLHMTTARRIGVTGIFAFGLLAVIASVVRLAIFYHAKVALKKGTDDMLLITTILFWIMIEIPLESATNSIRGLISRARRPQGSHSTITNIRNGNESTASHAKMVPVHGVLPPSVGCIAMRDLSRKPNDRTVPHGEIGVHITLTQSDDMV